jgi:hypothetical protein
MPIRVCGGGTVTDISNIAIGDPDTVFKWVAPDTLQLLVNNAIRQTWTTTLASPESAVPIGFSNMLHLTYP